MVALIHLISVGKLAKEFQPISLKYEKMIRWNLKCTEVYHTKKLSVNEIKHFEGSLIEKYLEEKSIKIALDIHGKNLDSFAFSKIFSENRPLDFIIGGAFGLDSKILKKCDILLSISPFTLPHQLAKIILLEQIYRSYTISIGHPYHK